MAAPSEKPHTLSSEQKLERFLTELAPKRDVAASAQNQAFNAIAFFYRDVLCNSLHDVNARATQLVHLCHTLTIRNPWRCCKSFVTSRDMQSNQCQIHR
jgi:hypothetical protein